MITLTLQQRADTYAGVFPDWPPPRVDARWLDAVWLMGNNYRSTSARVNGQPFYGAYPPGYLKRMLALFPTSTRILHVFAGSLPSTVGGARFDVRLPHDPLHPPGPLDACGDAQELGLYYPSATFDLVLADPPYTAADAVRYDHPMPDRRKVLREIHKVLEPGGHLVWLDTMLPQYRKTQWLCWGLICIVRSTNHRVRLASLFERLPDRPEGGP